MLRIHLFKRKLKRKGQINIAETVVSATIILVLAVSVAQLGATVAQSGSTNSLNVYKKKAQDALDLGLSLGYLRQLVYASTADYKTQHIILIKEAMQNIIAENLPLSAQYSLFQRTVNNQQNIYNNRTILGISPIPSGNFNIFSVSVLVSGYFNANQSFSPSFTATLIVAIGD